MAAVIPASEKKDFDEEPVVDASTLTIQSSMTLGEGVAGYQSAERAGLLVTVTIRATSALWDTQKPTRNMHGPHDERATAKQQQPDAAVQY
jgi:hypothetical protein